MIRMYICVCHAISERQIQEAVAQGARELGDLSASLGVGTCCGQCAQTATDYLPGGRYASTPEVDLTGLAPATVFEGHEIRRRVAA